MNVKWNTNIRFSQGSEATDLISGQNFDFNFLRYFIRELNSERIIKIGLQLQKLS